MVCGNDLLGYVGFVQEEKKSKVAAGKKKQIEPRRGVHGGAYVMEEQVGFLLRLANQRHTRIFAQKMGNGLTTTQFAALTKLHFRKKCTQNYLGALIAVDAVTIKGVVDRLVAKGLVQIVIDPADRRRRSISLSPQGEDLIERAIPVGAAITRATLNCLAHRDQKEFIRLLKRVSGLTKIQLA